MYGILVLCQVFTKDSKHNRKNFEKPNPSRPCPVDFLDDMGGCTHIACVQPHERYPCNDVLKLVWPRALGSSGHLMYRSTERDRIALMWQTRTAPCSYG